MEKETSAQPHLEGEGGGMLKDSDVIFTCLDFFFFFYCTITAAALPFKSLFMMLFYTDGPVILMGLIESVPTDVVINIPLE